ncbi:polyketide synthase [Paenibacillus silvae]|uniref:Polyketide synthase n=1 Tax=Paenibacillus silvae TaxID=1325358 RepID=A0ABQ1Z669_9BACL|nr:type I polyketide synthase [Paenibacillus silvae]GGH50425.1 polyketide synthase [Paenibacillus silvae]
MSDFEQSYESAIAIIGSTGRFPGAENIQTFWDNIRNGVESVTFHTPEKLMESGVSEDTIKDPNYVNANSMLDNIEYFDSDFFKYTPREAEMMDPQQRIFLEGAWEALENAGYDPETYNGLVGVFGGAALNTYMIINLLSNPDLIKTVGEFQTMIGNDKDFLTTRVSYKLNLKGPSVNVQTACSTSLTSVHMACQSLLNSECDMALAGGVTVKVMQGQGYLYQEGGISSPDGHCRAFDDNSGGTVFGSGMGIVVLKRLEDAIKDGDSIQAIIKGSAINNDGDMKIGYTAPSIDGQAEVIKEALAVADVSAETIGYIETHGTGTALGDPIEIAALTQAFQAETNRKQFCPIGSVKTNIGHLDAAAGIAGLIKTVESLKHKQLAPSLHFNKPNTNIDFGSSPFYVNTNLAEWPKGEEPRRAGVSSFGVGGTNVHVILEEAPLVEPSFDSGKWKLLPLSAKTDAALEEGTDRLLNHLIQEKNINLADAAYTLQIGRHAFEKRRIVVCRGREEAIQALENRDSKRVFTQEISKTEQPVVFMFPGQGAQYVDMGLELYQNESIFRNEVDRCAQILTKYIGFDIRSIIFPHDADVLESAEKLKQTQFTQPALFVIEYSLAKLWMAWGVKPHAMIGHSVGEYVAACLSGVFSLEDALRLITERGKLIQSLSQGSMLAVSLAEEDVIPLLKNNLSIAAINGPELCVVSGETESIQSLQLILEEQNVSATVLRTSHAFHSKMMDPILDSFKSLVREIKKNEPNIPYVSNVTGNWIQSDQATNPEYWAQHLRQTVRFSEGIETLLEDKPVLLEVGPGRTLSVLANMSKMDKHNIIISMRQAKEKKANDMEFLMNAVGKLWLNGVAINWNALYPNEKRYRIPMPSYSFQRQRYWVTPNQVAIANQNEQKLVSKELDRSKWFYTPVWKQSSIHAKVRDTKDEMLLVFSDEYGLHAKAIEQLQTQFKNVITVKAGESFKHDGNQYSINPKNPNDYQLMIQSFDASSMTILHMWGIKVLPETSKCFSDFEKAQELTFNSLLYLAQAFGTSTTDVIRLMVVTNNVQSVLGDDVLYPEASTVTGPVHVIPQEYSNIDCKHIDFSILPEENSRQQRLIAQLVSEIQSSNDDKVVAFRGNYRWKKSFESTPLEKTGFEEKYWRKNGVYLLTGGLGGIGLAIAEKLARTFQAKLILIGRTGLPDKQEWEQYIGIHGDEDRISQRIKKVQKLEELGSDVLTFQADVTDVNQMRSVIAVAEQNFGNINGILHLAGVPGTGLIQLKNLEKAMSVFSPKIKGAFILDELTREKDIDFMILFSSLSAIYGGLGQVDYTAANSFLDAFAHYQYSNKNRKVISINWGQWQFDDWQDEEMPTAIKLHDELKENRQTFGMSFEEGIDALFRTLYAQQPQMAVTTENLNLMIKQHEQWRVESTFEQLGTVAATKTNKAQISNDQMLPRNKVEEDIAFIWRELFGMNEIGIYDNFFDLGGHSLLAIQLLVRLREVFKVELSLNQLFEIPSIAEIADWISKFELESLDDDELESLLIEIESLEDEDIEKELESGFSSQ